MNQHCILFATYIYKPELIFWKKTVLSFVREWRKEQLQLLIGAEVLSVLPYSYCVAVAVRDPHNLALIRDIL